MAFNISLQSSPKRWPAAALALALAALMGYAAVMRFASGMLADPRLPLGRDSLRTATSYFPDSARLHARLAEAELRDRDRDPAAALAAAERAARLSPNDYRVQMTLAAAREAAGDRAGAEASLREAVRLAPDYADARWRLANLLVRNGKIEEAIDNFRLAARDNRGLLPNAIDLVWRASGEDLAAALRLAGDDANARMALARMLSQQGRIAEAVRVFNATDRGARRATAESGKFIERLIRASHFQEARAAWSDLVAGEPAPLVYNGGFESDPQKGFDQFDWVLRASEYARPRIEAGAGRGGARCLRLDFAGRDTTRLNEEVRQTVVVKPGTRYRLTFYARGENLETPEGPRVAVLHGGTVLGQSEPLAAGTTDWQPAAIEFITPQSEAAALAVVITIRRQPRYSFDEPTRGTARYDEFFLAEV